MVVKFKSLDPPKKKKQRILNSMSGIWSEDIGKELLQLAYIVGYDK